MNPLPDNRFSSGLEIIPKYVRTNNLQHVQYSFIYSVGISETPSKLQALLRNSATTAACLLGDW